MNGKAKQGKGKKLDDEESSVTLLLAMGRSVTQSKHDSKREIKSRQNREVDKQPE
jgi:hypothetical protein